MLLFFISGFTGLVYEIIWQRMLFLVFGESIFATTTILATFMAGLGIGAFLLGRFADQKSTALRLYGLLEIAVALFALLFPVILSGVSHFYISLSRSFEFSAYTANLIKFLLLFPVLLIPTILMGGTLPVITKAVTPDTHQLGPRLAGLYGINTLGAVLGCSLTGFYLISMLGTVTTTWIAAGINIVVGLSAIALYTRTRDDSSPITANTYAQNSERGQGNLTTVSSCSDAQKARLILIVTLISGFCALSYEVIWTRMLQFYMEQSIYAFPAMLTVFLAGLGIGSLLFTRISIKTHRLFILWALLLAAAGITAGLTVWQFSALKPFVVSLWKPGLTTPDLGGFLMRALVPSALIMGLPTILIGMVFPAAARLYSRSITTLGHRIGSVYATMTLGNVIGSIAAGFIFLPLFGSKYSILLIALLQLLAAVGVLLYMQKGITRVRILGCSLAVAGAVLITGITFSYNKPLFFYSPAYGGIQRENRILFHNESPAATVVIEETSPFLVTNKRYKRLEINSITVAGSSPMLRVTQKTQGHFPLLLFTAHTGRAPDNCFILGMGTGESSYSICTHDIDRLDCLELVPAEKDALPWFSDINHSILENPKFHPTFEDARSFLLRTPRTYDIIENDAIHPSVNITTYTKEYFELCKRRLTPDGIFSSWIPLFDLSAENCKVMIRTMSAVFPHVMIWYSPHYNNKHALLMGMKKPLEIDYNFFTNALQRTQVHESLKEFGLDNPYTILSSFIADESTLTGYARSAALNTDRTFYLPYHIPVQDHAGDETVRQILGDMLSLRVPVSQLMKGESLPQGFDSLLHRHTDVHRECTKGVMHTFARNYPRAIQSFTNALDIFVRDTHSESSRTNNPHIQWLRRNASLQHYCATARAHAARGDLDAARHQLHRALQIKPDAAIVYNILGNVYLQQKQIAKARTAFNTAVDIIPDFASPYYNLASIHYMSGDYLNARRYCDKALSINPNFARAQKLDALLKNEP